MQGWFMWIKMIFDFIKKIFGLVDEGTRKRRADQLDNNCSPQYSSPKKHCCGSSPLHGGRLIYADENEEEEIEYLGESHYSPVRSKEYLNGTSCAKRKQHYQQSGSFQKPILKNCRRNSVSKMNGRESKTQRFSLKSMNAMSSTDSKFSTLTKTNQLREKHEYSQLLQRFLPSGNHGIRNKTEEDSKGRAALREVIDLEKTETPLHSRPSCSQKSRDYFSTPNASTPTKWHTPRESLNLERAKTKNTDASIIGAKRLSNEKAKNANLSILSSRKTSTKSTLPFSQVIPTNRINDADYDESLASSRRSFVEKSEPSTSKIEKTIKDVVEIVPTNTLRDNLAAKAVMKNDFIPRIVEHYNDLIEQRNEEVEELKRRTCLLSNYNRLTREAALETQLARSMRLCEAVLDETALFDDEALPTLTPPMHEEIKRALVQHPPNETLVDCFGMQITRRDINTLSGLNWLNDEVINFYMNLLIARGNSGQNFPKVHAMNTFFYPKLISGGHNSLKRWTRKIDVFAQDLLVVPIHLGIHWCMSIIDFRDKSIRYYDSMGGANPKCLAALRQYLEDESMDKKKKRFDTNDWKLQSVKKIPQQMNGSDCGVFSCMFAEFISADRKVTFTQDDMPYFRKKMVYEILKAKLL